MAGHLRLYYQPYASPGDVELKVITEVEGETATLAHWKSKAATALSTYGNFVLCKTAKETIGNSEVQEFLVNVLQVQNVTEY